MQQSIFDVGILSKIRRNHGLEHATINLLSQKFPNASFAGYSDTRGFWITGNIDTDELLEIAQNALRRMKEGESDLAIHARCGTNFATAGVIAGTLAWLATLASPNKFKKKLDRWPLVVLLVTGALIVAEPLGYKVQQHVTTSGRPGDLAIRQIVRYERSGAALHRILTGRATVSSEEPA